MNRLWVRLTIYFGTFALIGVLLLVIVARLLVNDTVRQSFLPAQLQAPGGIVDTLGHYYQRHGDWAGVDNLMEGARATFRLWAGGMDLRVLDQNGVPVYQLTQRPGNPGGGMGGAGMAASGPPDNRPPGMGLMGRRRAPIELPITVNGQTVGFLEARLMMVDGAAGATGDIFQQLSSYILFVAVGAGILGAIFSVAASRMLTAPLNQLAAAARAIGAGNLAQRVESKGSDEVAAVAV
ncbi:MAG: methyl-accepting chemotaxis protein, partial [Caldilineaceae bacterium]|nr:methyl-accepting chemotaxis protein [Caldilineaceae bacterium]